MQTCNCRSNRSFKPVHKIFLVVSCLMVALSMGKRLWEAIRILICEEFVFTDYGWLTPVFKISVGVEIHSRTHSTSNTCAHSSTHPEHAQSKSKSNLISVLVRLVLASAVQLPRKLLSHPARIVDNVRDRVGGVAGMGADLIGSIAEATCATLVSMRPPMNMVPSRSIEGTVTMSTVLTCLLSWCWRECVCHISSTCVRQSC